MKDNQFDTTRHAGQTNLSSYSLFRNVYPIGMLLFLIVSLTACQGYTPPPPEPGITQISSPKVTGYPRVSITPKPSDTPTPTQAVETLQPIDQLKLNDIQLVLWRSRPVDVEPGDDLLLQMMGEFNRENEWGIQAATEDYDNYELLFEDLQLSLYGKLPDLFLAYPYQAVHADSSGEFLVDLNSYVNDPVWGFSPPAKADFYPSFWAQDEIDGKRLGVPFYRSTQMLYYNLSWGKELGFEGPPATPEEFKLQVCTAAQSYRQENPNAPSGSGGWAISTEPPVLLSWIYAFGGEIVAPDQAGYNFRSDEVQTALAFLRGLFEAGCAWKPSGQLTKTEFSTRQALIITGGLNSLPLQEEAFRQAGSRDRWTVLPFPSPAGQPAVVAYGPSLSILQNTPERQLAAWLLVKWLLTPENQARWMERYHAYPVRASAQNYGVDYLSNHIQWGAALDLLPYTRLEPHYPSWRVVRWALSDAVKFLYSPVFTADRIPALIQELDLTAADLYQQFR